MRRIVVTVSGPYVLAETMGVVDRQVLEDTWRYQLHNDERGLTTLPTEGEVRVLAAHVSDRMARHGERGPVAVVTNQYAMLRLCSTTIERHGRTLRAEVLRELADAERWLKVMAARA